MLNYVIRFVETLKARMEPTGCSIHAALQVELPRMDQATLLKLRDAALDLQRIVELELHAQRFDPAWKNYPAGWPCCVSCDAPALDGHLTCGRVVCNEAQAREAAR